MAERISVLIVDDSPTDVHVMQKALEQHGFSQVHNVLSGFEGPLNEKHQRNVVAGWRHDGLPWEQC